MFALVAAFAACNKERDSDQALPVYPGDTAATYDDTPDGHGCTDVTHTNNTASALVADFDLVLDNGAVNEMEYLTITNKSANAVSYEWDFGNGVTAVDAAPTHRYKIHGNYSITLTAVDARGNRQTVKKDLIVLCIFGGNSHDE